MATRKRRQPIKIPLSGDAAKIDQALISIILQLLRCHPDAEMHLVKLVEAAVTYHRGIDGDGQH